jgi:hypothetical protein
MAAQNALFKPYLFGDQELAELIQQMSPPAGLLADAVARLREGRPDEAEVILTAALITRPREMGPWHRLLLAAALEARGNVAGATAALRALAQHTTESRPRLWAFTALRRLGGDPQGPAEGALVEVEAGRGVETLAAYADGTARYLLPTGARVIWDRPDDRLKAPIESVIGAARAVAASLEAGRLPGEPGAGLARLTVLTPAGARSAEAPVAEVASSPAAPLYAAATALLDQILAISRW